LDTCEHCHPVCEHDTSNSGKLTADKDFANWKRLDCWKNDCWVFSKTVEMAYAVWSVTHIWVYWLR